VVLIMDLSRTVNVEAICRCVAAFLVDLKNEARKEESRLPGYVRLWVDCWSIARALHTTEHRSIDPMWPFL
jgi:hypothetical protein